MRTLIYLFILLVNHSGYCQNKSIEIGLEGGPNISNLRGYDTFDLIYKNQTNYSIGLFSQYYFNKRYRKYVNYNHMYRYKYKYK